jgi:hypothetical protein
MIRTLIELKRFRMKTSATVTPLHMRYGQALFNALHSADPELAEKIRGTKADPFFSDSKIPDFWRRLETEVTR